MKGEARKLELNKTKQKNPQEMLVHCQGGELLPLFPSNISQPPMSKQQYFPKLSVAFKSFCLESSCTWGPPRGEELVKAGAEKQSPQGSTLTATCSLSTPSSSLFYLENHHLFFKDRPKCLLPGEHLPSLASPPPALSCQRTATL